VHEAGPRLTYVRLVTVHNEGMEEEGDDDGSLDSR